MHKDQGKIEGTIHQAYHRLPPAQEAARKLFTKGVKEEDMTEVMKDSVIDYPKLCAVRDALSDLWKGIKT